MQLGTQPAEPETTLEEELQKEAKRAKASAAKNIEKEMQRWQKKLEKSKKSQVGSVTDIGKGEEVTVAGVRWTFQLAEFQFPCVTPNLCLGRELCLGGSIYCNRP